MIGINTLVYYLQSGVLRWGRVCKWSDLAFRQELYIHNIRDIFFYKKFVKLGFWELFRVFIGTVRVSLFTFFCNKQVWEPMLWINFLFCLITYISTLSTLTPVNNEMSKMIWSIIKAVNLPQALVVESMFSWILLLMLNRSARISDNVLVPNTLRNMVDASKCVAWL